MSEKQTVIVVEEKITIPTYLEPKAEKMPMFAENRVHQRSSGNPYPNQVVLKVDRTNKVDKEYTVIRLENEFLSIQILPEIGGRIFSAMDKTTGYDFFYKQSVIKPALIGMLGSWVSGGVEFNWPSHHRPSTFMPVDYTIENESDGSVTVWLSEHDPIDRMKGMVGVRLCPGESIFETRMKVDNRTTNSHSFLWWENAAVPVNHDYQLVLPPDVSYVNFHYDRSVSSYPKPSGVYNGIRMNESLDISMHKNTKQPTSYFSAASKYDFFGGYDHGKNCGVMHVANHHTSPGKKMFSWAYNQLSKSWEKALTDEDGEYAELMAGSYTDNQPDFAWLEPFETKKFSQFWFPIGAIGTPTYANTNGALSIQKENNKNILKLQMTKSFENATLKVFCDNKILLEKVVSLKPGVPSTFSFDNLDKNYEFELATKDKRRILYYKEEEPSLTATPEPETDLEQPEKFKTAQDLYLAGLHIQQYRDPKIEPKAYWLEAIKRDPEHILSLIKLGDYYYRRAFFEKALAYLEKAEILLTRHNPNPKDGEVYYLLGLVEMARDKTNNAYTHFYKASWNNAFYSCAMTMIASIDGQNKDYEKMLFHSSEALTRQRENSLARIFAAYAEYRLGSTQNAIELLNINLNIDQLDHQTRFLIAYIQQNDLDTFYKELYSSPSQTCLDIAFNFINAGMNEEAIVLLEGLGKKQDDIAAMVYYTLGMLYNQVNNKEEAKKTLELAQKCEMGKTFPFRLGELKVLNFALDQNPNDVQANYYVGCLLYDKGHYKNAASYWETTIQLDESFYSAYRNLAVAYFTHLDRKNECQGLLLKALSKSPENEQLIYELSYIMTQCGINIEERLSFLKQYGKNSSRDDIIIAQVLVLNQMGKFDEALEILSNYNFVPCEGGEHAVAEQYMFAHYSLGKLLMKKEDYKNALEHFSLAQVLPDNLGAGLWHEVMLVPHQYYEAICLEKLNQTEKADKLYAHILGLSIDYFSNMHLSPLPYYQACVLKIKGNESKGRRLMLTCLENWSKALKEKDGGYFKTTPFFISYCENATIAREAHYSYLIGLAKLFIGNNNEAEKFFEICTTLDKNKFYLESN